MVRDTYAFAKNAIVFQKFYLILFFVIALFGFVSQSQSQELPSVRKPH